MIAVEIVVGGQSSFQKACSHHLVVECPQFPSPVLPFAAAAAAVVHSFQTLKTPAAEYCCRTPRNRLEVSVARDLGKESRFVAAYWTLARKKFRQFVVAAVAGVAVVVDQIRQTRCLEVSPVFLARTPSFPAVVGLG